MKLQNAVARESISHHQVTANTNDKKKKSKVNQRSHQDRAGVSNPRNTLGNGNVRTNNISQPHVNVQELGTCRKRMVVSIASVTIEKLHVGYYDDIHISLPNLKIRDDKRVYKCVSFSDSHIQMINHSVLHRQPPLLGGILAQWGISMINPLTFSSSFLIHNQSLTDKISRFMENVIDVSHDVTAIPSEVVNSTHFLILFNKLRIASLQTKIGCALHNFTVSGTVCATTSPGNAGLVYVIIYTETDAIIPHATCGLCSATVMFKVMVSVGILSDRMIIRLTEYENSYHNYNTILSNGELLESFGYTMYSYYATHVAMNDVVLIDEITKSTYKACALHPIPKAATAIFLSDKEAFRIFDYGVATKCVSVLLHKLYPNVFDLHFITYSGGTPKMVLSYPLNFPLDDIRYMIRNAMSNYAYLFLRLGVKGFNLLNLDQKDHNATSQTECGDEFLNHAAVYTQH